MKYGGLQTSWSYREAEGEQDHVTGPEHQAHSKGKCTTWKWHRIAWQVDSIYNKLKSNREVTKINDVLENHISAETFEAEQATVSMRPAP